MPIFIDEVVFRGEVAAGPGAAPAATVGAATSGSASGDRDALISEVTQAVIEHLERAIERIGER